MNQIWRLPEVVAVLRNVGAEPAPTTPDDFTGYAAAERAKWKEVVKAAGVKIDQGPRDTFYNMREIEVVDPDGYRWCFGQDL